MRAVLIKNVDNYFRGERGGESKSDSLLYLVLYISWMYRVKIYFVDKLCGKCFLENGMYRFYHS